MNQTKRLKEMRTMLLDALRTIGAEEMKKRCVDANINIALIEHPGSMTIERQADLIELVLSSIGYVSPPWSHICNQIAQSMQTGVNKL